jgi:hypothetical protein
MNSVLTRKLSGWGGAQDLVPPMQWCRLKASPHTPQDHHESLSEDLQFKEEALNTGRMK